MIHWRGVILFGWVSCFFIIIVHSTSVKVAVLLPASGSFPFTKQKALPAIEIAIETLNDSDILPNHNLEIVYRDSACSETIGPLRAIDLYVDKLVDVYFGPCCDFPVAPIARFSSHWNIPVLSAGAAVRAFENKTMYSLLTRIQGSYSKNAEFVFEITRTFNWSIVGLLYHDNVVRSQEGKSNNYFEVESIYHVFKGHGIEPWHKAFDQNVPDSYDTEELLREASKNTRVVVLCASADSVRDIMIKAHDLNFDNGEYVFLNIDLFSSKDESTKPWFRPGKSEEKRNEKARKAYEALMTVTLRKPTSPAYKNFSEDVKRRAKLNDPNFEYGEEEVNSFVGAFHDAVLLYAIALNETLANNHSITNGTEITHRMWNRTFEGITGTVSIDSNGDRNADYSLLDMDPATGRFEVVANYFGKDKKYDPTNTSIHWAGGLKFPPPDTPKCGFDGKKCPPDKPFPDYGIVIIVLGSLLVIVLVAAFFIYRHIKLAAELAEMNWRVRWEDIMFGTMENDSKMRRQGSNISLTRTNNGETCAEGRVLIENGDQLDQEWCKCGHCEDTDRLKRVCCRQLELFGIFKDEGTCITSSRDFNDVVLNKQVLLAVYIHVMLVRRQRGAAPFDLSACKLRLMAHRQFLCWMHRGQKLKKESRMVLPSCVSRVIRITFPEENRTETQSRSSVTATSITEIMPLETET
ncbi:hypothetical protein FSP39_007846 [Pinctada imbricata]|uniref:Atrial natriuretic peptide receptor 3 n=1 Tax=Pinctada imbricata TaxID=66713 RepID=A0AA88XZB6_PINIB|nr:hypothetical protein FSP39_007846 [Pinctada imbricata]